MSSSARRPRRGESDGVGQGCRATTEDHDTCRAVLVVIVNHNTPGLCQDAVSSVLAQSHEMVVRVVVVNVGCESAGRFEGDDSRTDVIGVNQNVGFATGNNIGATASSDDWACLLLLNSDAILEPGCLKKLLATLDRAGNVGAVGPRLVGRAGSLQFDCARRLPSLRSEAGRTLAFVHSGLGSAAVRTQLAYHRAAYESPFEPECLSGACILIRREAWEAVGGFDERYFLYGEDAALAWSISRAGWSLAYVPSAVCVHLGGASATLDSLSLSHQRQGMTMFLRARYGARAEMAHRLLLVAGALALAAKSSLRGSDSAGEVRSVVRDATARLPVRRVVAHVVPRARTLPRDKADQLVRTLKARRIENGESALLIADPAGALADVAGQACVALVADPCLENGRGGVSRVSRILLQRYRPISVEVWDPDSLRHQAVEIAPALKRCISTRVRSGLSRGLRRLSNIGPRDSDRTMA
jgi:N-acetylglucosaminyl-diphospho-decaprenol L-rhamnosyltransferase